MNIQGGFGVSRRTKSRGESFTLSKSPFPISDQGWGSVDTYGYGSESGPGNCSGAQQLVAWLPHRFPQGLEDVSTYPVLIEELLNRHWSEEELQGVLRGNLLRVFRQVEQVCWAGQRSTQESEQV